jgi:hypothetical protein
MPRHWIWLTMTMLASFVLMVHIARAKTYKGAEYRTKDSFLYGRFEVRMKAIGREGTLASFFTYNDNYPATPWNEIDIEILGRYTDDVQFNTITRGQTNHVSHQYVSFNPAQEYHVYGFEWTPDYVAWFIDSTEVTRQTGPHIPTLNLPQKIMMNVWVPGYPNWVGTWNEAVLPAFAHYDWVRYASYTPGSGIVGSGNNFTPGWMDNFDSWDTTRWEKASHTWPGNNSDMLPENAVFQNGELILCLTTETALGYVDQVPPSIFWAAAEGDSIRLRFSEQIDQATAEVPNNYIVVANTPVAVAEAHLLPDKMNVVLRVPGLSSALPSRIIVQNIRDLWQAPNVMPLKSFPVVMRSPLSLPLKINVGGDSFQGYLADQSWSDTVAYGGMDGQTNYYSSASIAGTAEPEIYRSELLDLCEYKIRLPVGRYEVTLMMAENSATGANQRKMSIVVEGTQLETGLDLYTQAGFRTAYQKSALVDVTDGVLDIHMQGVIEKPLLNGITITSISTDVDEHGTLNGGLRIYELSPNYPNPFNPSTIIRYQLPRASHVTLTVYDVLGREVTTLVNATEEPGYKSVQWDAGGVASGVYFYRLTAGEFVQVRKVSLLR